MSEFTVEALLEAGMMNPREFLSKKGTDQAGPF